MIHDYKLRDYKLGDYKMHYPNPKKNTHEGFSRTSLLNHLQEGII